MKGLYKQVTGEEGPLQTDPLWERKLSSTGHKLDLHRWVRHPGGLLASVQAELDHRSGQLGRGSLRGVGVSQDLPTTLPLSPHSSGAVHHLMNVPGKGGQDLLLVGSEACMLLDGQELTPRWTLGVAQVLRY